MAGLNWGKLSGQGEEKLAPVDLVVEAGSQDEPPIGAEVINPGIRWELMYVLFLRMMAGIWLLKAVGYWAMIIGLGDLPFNEESRIRQGLTVGFALLDSAAAVGIWLVAPWGKSLWVFVVVFEILLGLSRAGHAVGLVSATGSMLSLFSFFVLAYAVRSRQLGKF